MARTRVHLVYKAPVEHHAAGEYTVTYNSQAEAEAQAVHDFNFTGSPVLEIRDLKGGTLATKAELRQAAKDVKRAAREAAKAAKAAGAAERKKARAKASAARKAAG